MNGINLSLFKGRRSAVVIQCGCAISLYSIALASGFFTEFVEPDELDHPEFVKMRCQRRINSVFPKLPN